MKRNTNTKYMYKRILYQMKKLEIRKWKDRWKTRNIFQNTPHPAKMDFGKKLDPNERSVQAMIKVQEGMS